MMNFFSEYAAANKIIRTHYAVIFYAENRYYHQYFERLLNDILEKTDLQVLYITSDAADPLLTDGHSRLKVVCIKQFLLYLLPKLKGDVLVTTMTGLGYNLYNRSAQVKCYTYVFHAAVSIHQQYTKNAFFNYDAFFALHDQHIDEIKRLQEKYILTSKDIIPYGYPLIDGMQKIPQMRYPEKIILIAPSWYDQCIFETCIDDLLKYLSDIPYNVVIRSHPEYKKRYPRRFKQLAERIKKSDKIFIDEEPGILNSLLKADLLITDRSGIALEYAFGMLRPVLFIDTPPKIMNPSWKDLAIEPFENIMRHQIGESILPEHLSTVVSAIERLIESQDEYKNKLQRLREEHFFNSESSYKKGVEYIVSKTRNN